jgi:hypothetical protein
VSGTNNTCIVKDRMFTNGRCISGIVGFLPKTLRRLYDLSVAGLAGDAQALEQAKALQIQSKRQLSNQLNRLAPDAHSSVSECEGIMGRISFSGLVSGSGTILSLTDLMLSPFRNTPSTSMSSPVLVVS